MGCVRYALQVTAFGRAAVVVVFQIDLIRWQLHSYNHAHVKFRLMGINFFRNQFITDNGMTNVIFFSVQSALAQKIKLIKELNLKPFFKCVRGGIHHPNQSLNIVILRDRTSEKGDIFVSYILNDRLFVLVENYKNIIEVTHFEVLLLRQHGSDHWMKSQEGDE